MSFLANKMLRFIFFQLHLQYAFGNILVPSQMQQSATTDISIVNTFSGCFINVINFNGLDINFPIITQPIVLQRYFSFPGTWLVFPFEMSPSQSYQNTRSVLITLLLNNRIVTYKNKRIFLDHELSLKYVLNILSNSRVLTTNKNTNCETGIHFHLPYQNRDSFLYEMDENLGILLKEPSWLGAWRNPVWLRWRPNLINSVPRYSLLIYTASESLTFRKYKYLDIWISSILHSPNIHRMQELILVLMGFSSQQELHVLCLYCNPCNPFQLVPLRIKKYPNSIETLRSRVKPFDLEERYPSRITIRKANQQLIYFNIMPLSIRDIIQTITKWNIRTNGGIVYLADIPMIIDLFPKNTTFTYPQLGAYNEYENKFIYFKMRSCGVQKIISYHPKLRPGIFTFPDKHLGFYKSVGLVFHRTQLRFVSCHEENIHWIHRLENLFNVFDVPMWIILIGFLILVSKINEFVVQKNYKRIPFSKTIYELYGSILDQSVGLYSGQARINSVYSYTLAILPLLFILLNNLYKGDNITNLTVNPPPIPFDTFDKLVTANFKVMSRRLQIRMSHVRRFLETSNMSLSVSPYANIFDKKHEFYPYVSEFWYSFTLTIPELKLTILSLFKNSVSNRTRKYFDNSEMYQIVDKKTGKFTSFQTIDDILEANMDNCNKSAVILNEEAAISLFNILKVKKKPTYYGKDIMNQKLTGYTFFGYFPTRLLLKPMYYFESGVTEWWDKYFKWALMMKTRTEEVNMLARKNQTVAWENDNRSDIYIICLIPLFGLSMSFFAFIFCEVNVINCFIGLVKKIRVLFRNVLDFLNCIICVSILQFCLRFKNSVIKFA